MDKKSILAGLIINGFVFTALYSLLLPEKQKNSDVECETRKEFTSHNMKMEENKTTNIYQERQALLSKSCENVPKSGFKGRQPVYFYAKPHGLAFCKTPKSGSTFVGTIVSALLRSGEFGNIFHVNREAVHGKNEAKFSAIFDNKEVSVKMILIVRNPYARLFSAFIDKYFVIGNWGRNLARIKGKDHLKMGDGYCGFNISFGDLLDALSTNLIYEEHTLPVTHLCKPCSIHYDIICKQETLTSDVEYILQTSNITDSKRAPILKMIHTSSLNDSLYGWISSQISYYKQLKQDCTDIILFVEKLWRALQLQGYILSSRPFPAQEFQKMKKFEAEELTTIMLKLIESVPQSKSQMSLQKKRMLAEAYSKINPETLARLKDLFSQDFRLFGYDTSIPV
ncbi:carbohydrate sulfotransferase 10-like isoform X1 [Argopecten irradians]|uniref:carbohydrate sulfotransferase 10-like isoform X1 n=2 Tax=Argopecten irradians TaxID=31199 RepID=UPI003719871F